MIKKVSIAAIVIIALFVLLLGAGNLKNGELLGSDGYNPGGTYGSGGTGSTYVENTECKKVAMTRMTGYTPSSMGGGGSGGQNADRQGHPLNFMEDYLEGKVPFVTAASGTIQAYPNNGYTYGTVAHIPALDKAYGKPIVIHINDTGGDFSPSATKDPDRAAHGYHYIDIANRDLKNDTKAANNAENFDMYIGSNCQPTPISNTSLASTTNGAGGPGCNGKALKNPIGNFGNPSCDFTKQKLATLLNQIDPTNADYWYLTVVKGESGYNPNAYASHESRGTPDNAGAWGLFQMGRGKNGANDHGDVSWQDQTRNAIAYNNMLTKIGKAWRYWATARNRWR